MPYSPEAFTGETGYTLTLTGEDGSPTEQLSGAVRLGADTLQVCQPAYRAVPPPEVESDGETRAAFAAVLRNLRENGILPDGRAAEGAEHGAGETNRFAVADVDGDGKEELVLCYVEASMAGMSGYVVGYDEESGQIHIQLRDFPSMEFYGSGAVKAMLSHNQSLGELWPYILYTYMPQTDSYQEGDMVTAWTRAAGQRVNTVSPSRMRSTAAAPARSTMWKAGMRASPWTGRIIWPGSGRLWGARTG